MITVFLDRDGVINRKPPDGRYVTSWREFEFLPGAVAAVRLLNDAGFRVIVVSNQRGVARGMMTEEAVRRIHDRMVQKMASRGARIDAVYFCPHEEGTCQCRKPGVGMFLQARAAYPDISFADSCVIGDSQRDAAAARTLGARVFLIGAAPGPGSLLEAVQSYIPIRKGA